MGLLMLKSVEMEGCVDILRLGKSVVILDCWLWKVNASTLRLVIVHMQRVDLVETICRFPLGLVALRAGD
jgi:hypothetical protein